MTRVAFSSDGAHVVSASDDNTVRFWDIEVGWEVRQLAGNQFALVEGLSGEHTTDRHVITALGDTLRIYEYVERLQLLLLIREIGDEQQRAEDGAAAAAEAAAEAAAIPVACFKAPKEIASVQCAGATICVGCIGAVCILSAPFLTA